MPLERNEISEQLKTMFERVTDGRVEADKVTETATITDDLALDSLDLLEMRFEMESIWSVTISDQDAEELRTVGDVIDLILANDSNGGE